MYHCKCGAISSICVGLSSYDKCNTKTTYINDPRRNKDIQKLIITPLRRINRECNFILKGDEGFHLLKSHIDHGVDVQGFIIVDILRAGIIEYASSEYNDYLCYGTNVYTGCIKAFHKTELAISKILNIPRLKKEYKNAMVELFDLISKFKYEFVDISEKRYYLNAIQSIGNCVNRNPILKAFLSHDVMSCDDLAKYANIEWDQANNVIEYMMKFEFSGEFGFPLFLEQLKFETTEYRTTLQFKYFLTWYFNMKSIFVMKGEVNNNEKDEG